MHAEQLEIASFLKQHPPFDQLPKPALDSLAQQIEISYFRAGQDILHFRDTIKDLYVVRSGAVETYRRSGELFNRLDQGGIFGQMGLMMNGQTRFPTKAIEDTLVYCIPVKLFNDYCERFDTFADYFETDNNSSLSQAISSQAENNDLTTVKVKELITREPITADIHTSIRQGAKLMTQQRVSSLLITDPNDKDNSQVVGIITDRDLRIRVMAKGVDFDTAINDIMSTDLITLNANDYVFEAMLTMLRFNIHHLPVKYRNRCIGVLSLSDIVRHESQSSILLVRGIFTQTSVDELQTYSQQLPAVFVRMLNEDANSHMIGSAMAVIGRSFKERLLQLAEDKLGPPPIPYCFIALGSMARDEQLIVTDQDNGIILDNSFIHEQHNDYFEQLATFVCDGLAACGYTYCTGNIMATNPKCRLTLDEWKQQFSDWVEHPAPQALLNCSIFFDLDGVSGNKQFATELRQHISEKAASSSKFLASMAHNALSRKPPLGFFKGFVLEKDGEHKNSINLKRRGTAPLTDAVRVHALAVGSHAQNSFERIDDIIQAGILPPGKGQDLSEALEYISIVRIRHQALAIQAGKTPDNNIEPATLSNFERRNLKQAFQVLDNAQNFLKFRYKANASVR